MSSYKLIANGDYVRERRSILRDFFVWKKMTKAEKEFFKTCYKCQAYDVYAENKEQNTCPCGTCEHHKTEVQVDNLVIELRRKYL